MQKLLIPLICALAIQSQAEDWSDNDLQIKITISRPSDWIPFNSSDPNAKLSKARIDNNAMFTLTARPIPEQLKINRMTDELAEEFAASVRGVRLADPKIKPITLDGVPAYGFKRHIKKSGHLMYRDYVFWIHNKHFFALHLVSIDTPVFENNDLVELFESIRLGERQNDTSTDRVSPGIEQEPKP